MRKLAPAYVVASVVIAVAGSAAFAQAVARPGMSMGSTGGTGVGNRAVLTATPGTATSTAAAGQINENSPRNTNSGNSNTSTNGNNSNNTSNANGTNTSTSNANNGSRSGANTDSSAANTPIGSTSATAGATSTTSANSGVNGTRSGSNMNSSAASTPIGAAGATGAASVNSSNVDTTGAAGTSSTTTTTTTTNSGNTAFGLGNFLNPAIAAGIYGVGNDGEPTSNNGSMNNNGSNDQGLVNNGNAGSAVDVETVRNSQNFDRAVRVVQRDRKRIGRDGQLLQSIAPRTNGVDRSNEMPDDPPSPALTGSSSALTRR